MINSSNDHSPTFMSKKHQGSCSTSNLFPYTIMFIKDKSIFNDYHLESNQNAFFTVSSNQTTSQRASPLKAKKQAPYHPSRIFSIDRINKENDHRKLTCLFRSCTTKDIHSTINQPILINTVQLNEHKASIRTKSRMKRKVLWLKKRLQVNEQFSNYAISPIKRGLSSDNLLTDILSLSPCKEKTKSLKKKPIIPLTKGHNNVHLSNLEKKSQNRNYFTGGLSSHMTFNKEDAVESYRREFTKLNKKQFCF